MTKQKKRILVEGLSNNFGGTEAVISNIAAALSSEISFDFIVPEALTKHKDLIVNDNRQIIFPQRRSNLIRYYSYLRNFMKKNAAAYSAVWMNKNNFGNTSLLAAAKRSGIPRRIIHIHSLTPTERNWYQTILDERNLERSLTEATDYWVCSDAVGQKYLHNIPYRVIPNAIRTENYRFSSKNRDYLRRRYGLSDSLVLGTVGRLENGKNQIFLVDILARLIGAGVNAKLMLVGEGSAEEFIRSRAIQLGISESVIFVGAQPDPWRFLSAFDVFGFPSVSEGLGMALIEAQINGLPCVASTGVPREASISNGVSFLPLDDLDLWATGIRMADRKTVVLSEEASRYEISTEAAMLLKLLTSPN